MEIPDRDVGDVSLTPFFLNTTHFQRSVMLSVFFFRCSFTLVLLVFETIWFTI